MSDNDFEGRGPSERNLGWVPWKNQRTGEQSPDSTKGFESWNGHFINDPCK